MFVYGCNLALSFVFTNNNDEYLLKKNFLLCFVFYIPDFQENIKQVIAQKLLETESMLFD